MLAELLRQLKATKDRIIDDLEESEATGVLVLDAYSTRVFSFLAVLLICDMGEPARRGLPSPAHRPCADHQQGRPAEPLPVRQARQQQQSSTATSGASNPRRGQCGRSSDYR